MRERNAGKYACVKFVHFSPQLFFHIAGKNGNIFLSARIHNSHQEVQGRRMQSIIYVRHAECAGREKDRHALWLNARINHLECEKRATKKIQLHNEKCQHNINI